MNEVLKKIKLATQSPVLILNAPFEYVDVMKDIEGEIHTSIKGKYEFIQLFANSLSECGKLTQEAIEVLDRDGYLWICYPKGTSKKYKSDLNRDTARELIGTYNYEPVTLVAIDNDWSALRIKNPDNIKTMKRKSAASAKGKERIERKE